jgi:hypothetical protein
MNRLILVFLVLVAGKAACLSNGKMLDIEQWDVFEIVLQGPEEGTPFFDIELSAVFSQQEKNIEVPGFYDGQGIYRIRFSPDETGEWNYKTESNAGRLSGKRGKFNCVPASGNNHGPLRIINTYYLQYADGTPFYSVGTTAYQWTSVKQSIQEQTIQTLADAPFNKIRMCVFPKKYRYGNDTEPWKYPFKREGEVNDYSQPDFEFF